MPESALVTDATLLFALLAGVLAVVFAVRDVEPFRKIYRYLPPVIWAYFIPMLLTTVGVIPADHPLYAWASRYLLLIALFLLMISVDVPAILKLGSLALAMMVAGTTGIVIGGPVSFALFGGLFDDPEAWKGFAALSGSWIGGGANMVAVQQSVGASADTLAPLIVVDVVVGYGWMGILIALSAVQDRFDRWVGADLSAVNDLNERLGALDAERQPTTIPQFMVLVGLAFAAAALCRLAGEALPPLGDIISHSTWAVLLVVTLGLVLSFTRLRSLEQVGASRIGYVALYLLLATIGAQADLAKVLEAPLYLLAGVVWILIHIAILFLVAKLLKAPLFFVATGSMANIGGAASAPIVAGVYLPAMAPVGLLMAVAGYFLGIYAALFCAYLLSLLGG